MKYRTGDDEESGRLKLGTHAFAGDESASDSMAGGFSRAIRSARGFGRLILTTGKQSMPGGGGYDSGGGGRGRGPRGPIP